MKKKDVNKKIEEKVRKICRKVWKVPQEQNSSTMTTSTRKLFKIFFRPNNYRRQIRVKEKNQKIINSIKSTIRGVNFTKHTKLLTIKNYKKNITIQYGKYYLTGIYSQPVVYGTKTIYLIERETINEIENKVSKIKENIKQRIDQALKQFSRKFNLIMPYERIKWTRYEDFIKGEEYIDKIPKEVIIHDTIFKKVYPDGIEFIDKSVKPTVRIKTYIKNRAIENISPEICKELDKIYNILPRFELCKELVNECKTIEVMLKDTILLVKIPQLNENQRNELSDYTFERFGK